MLKKVHKGWHRGGIRVNVRERVLDRAKYLEVRKPRLRNGVVECKLSTRVNTSSHIGYGISEQTEYISMSCSIKLCIRNSIQMSRNMKQRQNTAVVVHRNIINTLDIEIPRNVQLGHCRLACLSMVADQLQRHLAVGIQDQQHAKAGARNKKQRPGCPWGFVQLARDVQDVCRDEG